MTTDEMLDRILDELGIIDSRLDRLEGAIPLASGDRADEVLDAVKEVKDDLHALHAYFDAPSRSTVGISSA
jgi:hypothetical protein